MNKTAIAEALKTYKSCYVYEENGILSQGEKLLSHLKGVEFLYSLKTNPAKKVLQCIFSQGFGADAASLREVLLAKDLGLPKEKILFSTPGKSKEDIIQSIDHAIIIADSQHEIALIEEVAKEKAVVVDIGIRINPDFTFAGPGGISGKFGIDEEKVLALLPQWQKLDHVNIVGVHVHSRSQELDSSILEAYYKKMLSLADKVSAILGYTLDFVNVGSGLGIPYSPKDKPLDTESLGASIEKLLTNWRKTSPKTRLIVETGRFLVGESGTYATTVLDKKESMGKTYVILANTLNGFVRPSLAQLVGMFAGGETTASCEPLFTAMDAFDFIPLVEREERETVTLVGNLCTAADVVAKDIALTKLEIGDGLMMTKAGSYAATLSPMAFSSPNTAVELFLDKNGALTLAND